MQSAHLLFDYVQGGERQDTGNINIVIQATWRALRSQSQSSPNIYFLVMFQGQKRSHMLLWMLLALLHWIPIFCLFY